MDPLQQIQEDQKSAIVIITNAKEQIEMLLTGQEAVRIGVLADLTRASNRLHGLAGTAPDNSAVPTFGPMTAFMGEPIVRPEPIDVASLVPTDSEKEQFRAKRNELLNTISDKSDDDVFAILNQPQGEALLRNVARKAGVAGYDNRVINTLYLSDLRIGIAEKRAEAEAVFTGNLAKALKQAGAVEVTEAEQADAEAETGFEVSPIKRSSFDPITRSNEAEAERQKAAAPAKPKAAK